jgi:hypothetical protein
MMMQKAVYLEWDDSCSDSGWTNDEKIKTFLRPWVIKSIGYIVGENKTHIAITTSIGQGGNKMDVLTIPKACISKRRVLKI